MELIEKGFGRGVVDCYNVWEDDTRRRNCAKEEADRAEALRCANGVKRAWDSIRDCGVPLWQRISELTSPDAERAMRPMLRRERIRKLLKAVDQILRAELKPPVAGETASPQQRESIEALKTDRSVFWDPLPETCFYLEIGQSKLAQYSRQLTGLGAKDLVDRIRVENLRASIRERLRKVAQGAQGFATEDVKRLSARDGAGVLLKALKASEHFLNRQELALSVGIASKARLYRACLACERATLEEIERQEAEKVFAGMREKDEVPVVGGDSVASDVAASETVSGVKSD